jgi:putative Mg2+ transporter-C (MgtC) family protein
VDVDFDIIARLLVAAGLGAAIGLEREASDQPAGLRTHLAVALGAGLFGVVSTTGFGEFETTQQATNIQFDVTRVASLVVSGIGFIGAGLIFRHGTSVRNLTTAASLWVSAAIGLSCGVGDFAPAIATTVLVLVALVVLRVPRAWIREYVRADSEDVRVQLGPGIPEAVVIDAIDRLGDVRIDRLTLEKEQGAYVVSATIRAKRGVALRDELAHIARLDEVVSMSVGNSPVD